MFYSVLDSMRIRHWVKNLFVFIPLIISGSFFNLLLIKETILAFLSFSFLASCIYLFNDIIDIESDRLHLKKKKQTNSKWENFNSFGPCSHFSFTVHSRFFTVFINQ